MMVRNQRPDRRSYRICGSLVILTVIPPPKGVMTDWKKTSGSALTTPSATPVALLKVRSRPFIKIKNCDGPTAPIESGGNAPVSVGPVTPSNFNPTVWEKCGPEGAPAAVDVALEILRPSPGGICRSKRAAGAWGRLRRPGISSSRFMKVFFRGPRAAWAVMMSDVRWLIPCSPVAGRPSVKPPLLDIWPNPPTPKNTDPATSAGRIISLGFNIQFGRDAGY